MISFQFTLPSVFSNLPCLPGIVQIQKIVEHLIAALPGLYRVLQFAVSTQIVGFSFEGDLRTPFSAFALIHAVVSALVAAQQVGFCSFQLYDGSSVHKAEIFTDGLTSPAAAADRVPGLQIGLAYQCFISAVAAAAPEMLPLLLSRIGGDGQPSKAFSDIVLPWRMAQTAAALYIRW